MDTKSKNFSYNRITKIVMFLIATVLVISAALIPVNMYKKYGTLGIYHYQEHQTEQLLQSYDKEFNTDYATYYSNTKTELENGLDSFETINEIILDNNEHSVHELLGLDIQQYINKGVRYVINDSFDYQRVIGTDGITNNQVRMYDGSGRIGTEYGKNIEEYGDVPKDVLDNVKPNVFASGDDSDKDYEYLKESDDVLNYSKYYGIYVFYDDEVGQPIEDYRNMIDKNIQMGYIKACIYMFLAFLICIYFMFVAGKTSENSETKYNLFDKIPFDILTILVTLALTGIGLGYVVLLDDLKNVNFSIYTVLAILASSTTIFYCANFGKRIRNKELFSSFFIVIVIKKIFSTIYNKIIRPIYDLIAVNSSISIIVVMVATVVFGLLGIAVPFFSFLLMVMTILLLVNSLKVNKAVNSIKNGESFKAKNSILNYPYDTIFENLEDISENVSEVVQKNMASQRTQVTLVTNVSHDLRTPLTSIIGYVDLLSKKADMYDEETQEYINVLKEKSERMGTMVEDLFDISKSASGDVILNKENLNVKKLVEQTLGELDDVIEYEDKIELNLVNDVCIFADGNKMYRVFQNTIENALKYSLDGTRIYITSEVIDGNKVRIEIKNIANYRMNFTGEEIVQRFKRGDESRTTKGSGLGLSIAQIFTNINGGDFDVVVDGDLFKVVIVFNINM